MSTLELVQPLHARRPLAVSQEIESRAATAKAQPDPGYFYHGENTDYELKEAGEGVFVSDYVSRLSTDLERRLRILDIGAGAGGFVLRQIEDGHAVQGLSLHDYRTARRRPGLATQARRLSDDAYRIGDVQNLHAIEGLRTDYDFIVGRWVFPHLIDPLGALEQVVDRLAPRGVAAITRVPTDFCYEPVLDAGAVIDVIESAGYVTEGSKFERDGPSIPLLVIQRGESAGDLRFPVEFRATT